MLGLIKWKAYLTRVCVARFTPQIQSILHSLSDTELTEAGLALDRVHLLYEQESAQRMAVRV